MLTKYDFEYQLIPQLIDWVENENPDAIGNLADRNFFEVVITKQGGCTFYLTDFKAEAMPLVAGKSGLILYTFPKPEKQPEALFGGIVITFSDNLVHLKYYTLELGARDGKFFVCEVRVGVHRNLGVFDGEVSKEGFVKWLKEM